jgi:hypothetical protein
MQEDYKDRVSSLRSQLASEPPSKYNILVKATYAGEINSEHIDELLHNVEEKGHKLDFDLLPLLRFLYVTATNAEFQNYHFRIDQVLCDCPFWPSDASDNRFDSMRRIIFWSENHIFMFLSSAVLYRQRCRDLDLPCMVGEKEENMLLTYLEVHVAFGGVYEVLSHVYLPYTFSALLNLFDFSESEHIRSQADNLLNLILRQILLGTNSDGVCTLTASSRTYPKFRFRNWGHNVNMLVFIATGISADSPRSTAVTDFTLTSSWVPSEATLAAFSFSGFIQQQSMNHPVHMVRDGYSRIGRIDALECVPFFW